MRIEKKDEPLYAYVAHGWMRAPLLLGGVVRAEETELRRILRNKTSSY